VVASIVRDEPKWNLLPASTPDAVRTLLRRCLTKDVRLRLRDIGEARIVLAEPLAPSQPDVAVSAAPARAHRAAWFVAAVALVTAAGAGVALWWTTRPAAPLVGRFVIQLPDGHAFTAQSRPVLALSPDGTRLVYVAQGRLYLRGLDEFDPRPVVGDDVSSGAANPIFSPDGRWIVFYAAADSTLKRVAASGGAAVTICTANQPWGMTWSGDAIFFADGKDGIFRVAANGGKPERVVGVGDGEYAYGPQVLPDGVLLFTARCRRRLCRIACRSIRANTTCCPTDASSGRCRRPPRVSTRSAPPRRSASSSTGVTS